VSFRPCILIPTYDNPRTIRAVAERAGRAGHPLLIVDDGSGPEARAIVEEIAALGLAEVLHRTENGGKGAAVKDGFRFALERGFSHALQVDADGQHDLDDIPRFIECARQHPDHLVLGAPVFDHTVPAARRFGRQITVFWVHLETAGRIIRDPMCGFRVYPLEAAARAAARGNRMDFDPELAVRLVWQGTPVTNLETKVRYLSPSEGGVSHFQMFWDNARISWMHTRLVLTAIVLWLTFSMRRARA
jgi:glycosyltransferase involved in cell wall biosynthesis